MDSYVRQEARVIWNSCHSTYFRLKNGVKQGGVFSPTLFNLYIGRLCDLDDREAITAILNSQNAVDYEEINGLL